MIWPGELGLAVVAGIALLAPRLARQLAPAAATRLLATGAAAAAATTSWLLAMFAGGLLAPIAAVAGWANWSPRLINQAIGLPAWAAAGSALAAGAGLIAGASVMVRELLAVRAMRTLLTASPAAGLVVIDDDRGRAFAVPGRRRRIVVTTGLIRALDPAECRAVIAHEASHLRHRHAWLIVSSRVAAAINPMLRGVAAGVAHAAERWADEDAARDVGDRAVVASAVARAALLMTAESRPTRLAAVGGRVPDRVRALLMPAPSGRVGAALIIVAMIVGATLAAGLQSDHTEDAFEHATVSCPATNCR